MLSPNSALVIVDMQNYYLRKNSAYYEYFNDLQPGCLDYILDRCEKTVIPNIRKLISLFQRRQAHIIYLRLCGTDQDRNDLHRFFRETWLHAKSMGFDNAYPLMNDPLSQVIDELAPAPDSTIITKTTFSAFSSSTINKTLTEMEIKTLVFSGLATSQCVETTARDASDHGFQVIHIEDAQADYDEFTHNSSLYCSRGVCGGIIYETDSFINQ
ncbi:MAG: cysteine hydrolase [bacterium]|nr:cysteine hydrolase [bacterium]